MKHTHDIPRQDTSPEQHRALLAREVQQAAEQRTAGSEKVLGPGSGRNVCGINLSAAPLVAKERYSGKYEEGLSALILIGDGIVLGVSRGFNFKNNTIDSIRISVLPIGEHTLATRKHSSATLGEFSPRAIAPGQVETLSFGRQDIAEKTGQEDKWISGDHFDVTVDSAGGLGVIDHSTNGTQIITHQDTNELVNTLGEKGRASLNELVAHFTDNMHEWDEESQGVTVVEHA